MKLKDLANKPSKDVRVQSCNWEECEGSIQIGINGNYVCVNRDDLLAAIPPGPKKGEEVTKSDDYEGITTIILDDGKGEVDVFTGVSDRLLKCLSRVGFNPSLALYMKTGD